MTTQSPDIDATYTGDIERATELTTTDPFTDDTIAAPTSNPAPEHGLWMADNATYHADRTCLSSTGLKKFRRSPVEYAAEYITGTVVQARSNALDFGSAFHAILEDENKYLNDFAWEPICDGRTTEGKSIKRDFAESSVGKTILKTTKTESHAILVAMFNAVYANPASRAILEHAGTLEQAMCWRDKGSGVRLKIKPDKQIERGHSITVPGATAIGEAHIVIDYKSDRDSSPATWNRNAHNLGYANQNALYAEGVRQVVFAGDAGIPIVFLHIVVSKSIAAEARVFYMQPSWTTAAAEENRANLSEFSNCQTFDNWDSREHGRIIPLDAPRYAARRDDGDDEWMEGE